ncbi:penicillin-binding protein, 1A family [Rhodomicrobium vannielii ATCC 17100]|uniref:Penicillin-binding protein, 1A family n=1 Tax=Rhodomicrobium vannielii (strain ATCC 17100 / DSM 162 / LMG 4299 / NCIMB 10020 / ATH 3.1.1) TaxID=648757 RepID=E3I4J2_RHOVT|nr:PBP1A family penicillin-binding protein [Rhodomicrobium vannielii]ADP71574.1 penicillin-binding protein, 1A family [Rhodomicrobium vannielii ATCC 17100]
MRDWITKPNRRSRSINWLALDSWIDSSLYGLYARFKDSWANYNNFFQRFRVTGSRRMATEFVSEAMTLGTAGLAVVLMFELPAIELTKNPNWRTGSEFSVTFLDRYGNEIGKRGIQFSDAVPLEEIPDVLVKATMATEDRRFFDHFGIDIIGTGRAIVQNARSDTVVQGGSSLTQQLAKNLFLSSERSLQRKIREVYLALWLEAHLTKKEILKLYLDRAYLGGGTFGVEAASQFYFGKSVRDINLAEASVLAGLFKAPTKYAPHSNPAESRARTNQVLTNLVDAGFMTEGQVHAARLNAAKIIDRQEVYVPNYFLDWAFEEVQRLMKGKGEYVLTARTTVDVPLQKLAEQVIDNAFEREAKYARATQASLVSMDTDGAVRVIVGGRDYGDSQFNRATKGQRQPGSSFKPYVYLTAIESGIRPNKVYPDVAPTCGNWSPSNYGGGVSGRAMTLYEAMARSVNTIAVRLSLDVGRDKLLENVHKIGLTSVRKTCSMALGDSGIAPLDHTAGFAVFASGGKAIRPYAIVELRNTKDEVVYSRERDEPAPAQIFKREDIETLNTMLEKVVTEGSGAAARLDFTTAVGKTGTSSGPRDVWFMGFTGQYVTGVWFGNDDFSEMAAGTTGGHLSAPVWHQYMAAAHTNMDIPQIPGLPLHPRQVEERQRLSEIRRDEPGFGGGQDAARRMPIKTQKMLTSLSKLLKEARKLQAADTQKDATLDNLPVSTQ